MRAPFRKPRENVSTLCILFHLSKTFVHATQMPLKTRTILCIIRSSLQPSLSTPKFPSRSVVTAQTQSNQSEMPQQILHRLSLAPSLLPWRPSTRILPLYFRIILFLPDPAKNSNGD